jgi:Rieske Fe-S protein
MEKSPNGQVRLQVALYPDLAREGGAVTLRVPGERPLLVMHPGGDQYAVVTATCTHKGCPLGFEEGVAVCPCHGSRFGLDGQVLHPPASTPLSQVASRYDAVTGVLVVDFKAGDPGFPTLVDGKVVFPFTQFPALREPGGVVQGVPSGHGKRLFVFALEGGAYAAVDALCTHQQCEVGYEASLYGGEGGLLCPCHGSEFRKTGEVTQEPARRNLTGFTASSDGSAVVVLIPG